MPSGHHPRLDSSFYLESLVEPIPLDNPKPEIYN